ncbi:response regulator (plasmid) [Paraburkholderia caledonica]|nr:response regulator [Paraburkholderia caledonica]
MYPVRTMTDHHRWTGRQICTHGRPLRVLIVDDEDTQARALAACLVSEDMHARVATGGTEAVDGAVRWLPHVILMDISMPGYSGYHVARVLRQGALTGKIVIIAHTSLEQGEVRGHVRGDEFDGYIQKGQPVGHLVRLVQAFVECPAQSR